MRQVKSDEARRLWRDLLDEAERGGQVEVLRYDRSVAFLVPAGWYREAAELMEAKSRTVRRPVLRDIRTSGHLENEEQ